MKKLLLALIIAVPLILNAEIMTLQQAKEVVLVRNAEYQSQLNAYYASKWGTYNSGSKLLPSASLNGSYMYQDPAPEAGTTTLSKDSKSLSIHVSQPLFVGGKIWLGYQISRDSQKMTALSLDNKRLSTYSELEIKYFAALQAKESVTIAEKSLQSAKITEAIAQTKFESGNLSRADYLRLQTQTANQEIALLQARNGYDISIRDLTNFLHNKEIVEPVMIDYSQYETLITKLTNLSGDQLSSTQRKAIEKGSKNNMGLAAAAITKAISKKTLRMTEGDFLPSLNLTYQHSWDESRYDSGDYSKSGTLMLVASMPIFPIVDNYSGFKKAQYDYRRVLNDYQVTDDGIRLGIESNSITLVSSARQVLASRKALSVAEQTHEQMLERYRNNLVSASDMLDADILLQSSQLAKTSAEFSFVKTLSSFQQQLGTDQITVINEILP